MMSPKFPNVSTDGAGLSILPIIPPAFQHPPPGTAKYSSELTAGGAFVPATLHSNTAPRSQTILLTEDNRDLLEIMKMFLEMMDYVVIPCRDAHIASAAFRSNMGVDMLITDLEMPGKTGLELARELTAPHPSLPVVIVSGSDLSREMRIEMEDRGWPFLAKPYELPVLFATVESLLRPIQEQAA